VRRNVRENSRMDPQAVFILLAIVFVAGVMIGYGIRSLVSKKRRERARKKSVERAIGELEGSAFVLDPPTKAKKVVASKAKRKSRK
jgi:hypothetical protein